MKLRFHLIRCRIRLQALNRSMNRFQSNLFQKLLSYLCDAHQLLLLLGFQMKLLKDYLKGFRKKA